MLKYEHISDPGHSWFAVPLKELKELGIAEKISSYSYILGPVVYLEEDCDAELWFQTKKVKGHEAPAFVHHFQDPCPIRTYPPYRGESGVRRAIRPSDFHTIFGHA